VRGAGQWTLMTRRTGLVPLRARRPPPAWSHPIPRAQREPAHPPHWPTRRVCPEAMPRCRRATRHKNRRSEPPESLTVARFGRADVLPIGKATSPAEFDQQPEDVARGRGTARSAPWVGFIQHAYCGADTRGECRGGRRAHALAGPHRVGCARTFITAGEDKTDDAVGGRLGEPPEDRSKGRLDQAPEPVPNPGLRPGPAAAEPVIAPRTAGPTSGTAAIQHSRTGGLWAGLILSALVLLLLLVFMLQNGIPYRSPSSPSRAYSPSGWRCCWRRSPGSCSWRFRAA
jgi:hypothetical protein